MLIRQGHARSDKVDRHLACTLAAVAGSLNTAVFHAVGFFSANMTGNVSALSDRLALGDWLTALFYLMIVLAFIGGATTSTLLINAGRRRGIEGIYAHAILAEAVLMFALGAADPILSPLLRNGTLILGLSFLMGLQNAVVTNISQARVRTTHISGMATDIGIEFATLADIARGAEAPDQRTANTSKLRLHGGTLLSFLAGGVLGVLAYRLVGDLLLFGTATVLLALAAAGLRRIRQKRRVSAADASLVQ
jgi:uncharacterized membrane protein YoaK (UPF0700 family)